VSVLIPAYNAQPYIGDTLESVLDQSFRSFEIIVVDDGSTDGTRAIAENYRGRGVVILSQSNAGPAAARNRALSHARGKFIALLDSDDIWERDFLQTMVQFLDRHPDVSIAFCDSRFFGETRFAGKTFQEVYPPCPPITLAKVAGCVSHVCLDAILRREVFDRVGAFDEALRAAEDFDLWLRALHAGCRIEPVPRVLVRYRRHAASVSAQGTLADLAALQVLGKWRGRAALDAEEHDAVERTWRQTRFKLDVKHAVDHIHNGEFSLARAALQRACAYRPKWRYRAARLALAIAPEILRRTLRRIG
jgi:glycosyltransferase involved in cell wall biosynthesis